MALEFGMIRVFIGLKTFILIICLPSLNCYLKKNRLTKNHFWQHFTSAQNPMPEPEDLITTDLWQRQSRRLQTKAWRRRRWLDDHLQQLWWPLWTKGGREEEPGKDSVGTTAMPVLHAGPPTFTPCRCALHLYWRGWKGSPWEIDQKCGTRPGAGMWQNGHQWKENRANQISSPANRIAICCQGITSGAALSQPTKPTARQRWSMLRVWSFWPLDSWLSPMNSRQKRAWVWRTPEDRGTTRRFKSIPAISTEPGPENHSHSSRERNCISCWLRCNTFHHPPNRLAWVQINRPFFPLCRGRWYNDQTGVFFTIISGLSFW